VSLDLEPLLRRAEVEPQVALFGEGPGGIVVSGSRDALMELSSKAAGVGFLALGTVGGENIRSTAGDATIDLSVDDARRVFETALSGSL
jgi:hypothetical protein